MNRKTVYDLLITALEGGSNHWYYLPDLSMCPKKGYTPVTPEVINSFGDSITPPQDFYDCAVDRIWEAVIFYGESIPVHDKENLKERLGYINQKTIENGLSIFKNKYPNLYEDCCNEDFDADHADVFFQLVVMGELVFG